MSPENQFILRCLEDFCHETLTNEPDVQIDMDTVLEQVQKHSLAGIIIHQCSAWIRHRCQNISPDKIITGNIFVTINRREFLREITDRFRQKNIDIICMKGSVFRGYYPDPLLREMGDMDLIIRHEDRSSSDKILHEDMQFGRMIDNHDVWVYGVRQFAFEIHDHMFYENLANRVDYRGYFDQVWEHCHNAPVFGIESDNLFVPDEEFHFLYLMAHTAKHIINNGSGFRAYLDMVLMVKNCDLDWELIEAELEKLELLEFTRTSFALCERWFGVEMPLGEKHLDEDFYLEVTQKTFEDGVFGLENKKNAGSHTAKEIKHNQRSYMSGAIRLTIRKVFPPYRDMQLIPWYAWVDGRPWLMPAAWVYRWFYCIRNKRKNSMDLLTEPFVKRGSIEKREAYIKSWGL